MKGVLQLEDGRKVLSTRVDDNNQLWYIVEENGGMEEIKATEVRVKVLSYPSEVVQVVIRKNIEDTEIKRSIEDPESNRRIETN